MDIVFAEPAGGFVLVQTEGVGSQGAEVAVEGEVEFGVVVFHCVQQTLYSDVRGEFFADFAHKGLLRGLPCLYLSAREFPPVLEIAIAALGSEYLTVLADDGGYDFYPFNSFEFRE